jgi:antitoxin component YwqK of YwqJK toxin-antitoxin module
MAKSDILIEREGDGEWIGCRRDGKREGSWSYYEGCALLKTVKYIEGLRQGLGVVFDSTGRLKLTLEFEQDRINGLARFYSSDGQNIATYNYIYDKLDRVEYYLLHEESPPKDKTFLPEF